MTIETEKRVIKYFERLQTMKPSEFNRNWVKEWYYLGKLGEIVLNGEPKQESLIK